MHACMSRAPIQECQKLSRSVVQKVQTYLTLSSIPSPFPIARSQPVQYPECPSVFPNRKYIPSGGKGQPQGRPSLPSPISGRKAKTPYIGYQMGGGLFY